MKLLNLIIEFLLYPLAIRIYYFTIFLASFFNSKAKKWISGRKNWKLELYNFKKNNPNQGKIIWVHSASLGEFEQARPIITELKKTLPNCQIVCTFYSPSGYEIRKNYKQADYVAYLPLDTKSNAKFWIKTLQPNLVLWVKYDIWANFLIELKNQQIPSILFSAIFREKQHYFKSYGGYFKKALQRFSHIFVQNESSLSRLKAQNFKNVSIAADTRFDRVWQNAQKPMEIPPIFQFINNKKTIVAGSTWQADEAILIQFINKKNNSQNWKLIIAPHEISATKIADLRAKIKAKTILFSEIEQHKPIDFDILIIDCIGLLSSIYQYGNLAYIGGGFGAGIHNILEPAVFNLPIIFGSKYEKFQEAKDILQQKGAINISNFEELEKAIQFFENNKVSNKQYVKNNIGGTALILEKSLEILR